MKLNIKSKTFALESEWLKHRENYISSTECAALFNVGSFQSYYKLWHLKNKSLDDDFKDTELTQSGRRYENCTADHFCEDYNSTVRRIDEYIFCENNKIGSSYDFFVTSGEYENYILETKRLLSFSKKNWIDGEPPLQYQLQCQHQLLLYPKAKGVILCCLIDGWKLELFIIEKNEKIHELILETAGKFWSSIYENNEPVIDWNDLETASKLNSHTNGQTVNATPEFELLAEEFDLINQKIKVLDKEKDILKVKMQASTKADIVTLQDGRRMDLKVQEASEGKIITQSMVGTRIGARKSFRRCQIRGKIKT